MSTLVRFHNPFSSLFDDLFDTALNSRSSETQTLMPRVDVYEKDGAYHLQADLPGIDKSDVKVTIDDGILTISGKRELQQSEEGDNFYRYYERSFGEFSRSFRLPDTVDPDKIKANMKNGVLELIISKDEKKAPREVQVKIG